VSAFDVDRSTICYAPILQKAEVAASLQLCTEVIERAEKSSWHFESAMNCAVAHVHKATYIFERSKFPASCQRETRISMQLLLLVLSRPKVYNELASSEISEEASSLIARVIGNFAPPKFNHGRVTVMHFHEQLIHNLGHDGHFQPFS